MFNQRPTKPDIVVKTEGGENGTAQILHGLSLFQSQIDESVPETMSRKIFDQNLPGIKTILERVPAIHWNPSWLSGK